MIAELFKQDNLYHNIRKAFFSEFYYGKLELIVKYNYWFKNSSAIGTIEACIGVLGIQDICHFTSRDIGYSSFYFQGYGILCSIFWLLLGILNI